MPTSSRFPGYRGILAGSIELGTEPELPGRFGRIIPFDDEILAVSIEGTRRFKKLAAAPGARVFCEGDSEGTVLLPNALLDVAAGIIEAPKRRRVTEERMAQLREIGRTSRFGKSTA